MSKPKESKEVSDEKLSASSISSDISRIASISSIKRAEVTKVTQIPLQYEVPHVREDIKIFESNDASSPESFGLAAAFAIAMLAGKKTETLLSRIYASPESRGIRLNNPTLDAVCSLENKIDVYNLDIQNSKKELDDAERSICRIEAIVQKLNSK